MHTQIIMSLPTMMAIYVVQKGRGITHIGVPSRGGVEGRSAEQVSVFTALSVRGCKGRKIMVFSRPSAIEENIPELRIL